MFNIITELTQYLKDQNVNYFLTGSHAFGLSDENSDYDICVNISDQDKIHSLMCSHYEFAESIKDDCDFTAVSFRNQFDFGKVDFIVLFDEGFKRWKVATDEVIRLVSSINGMSDYLKDKRHRIALFEILRMKVE